MRKRYIRAEQARYKRNKEQLKANSLAFYHKNKDEINAKKREKRAEIRKVNGLLPIGELNKMPRKHNNAKSKILKHYGKQCACCSEDNSKLLTVEHLNNDGYKTRRRNIKGAHLYSYLINENYPTGIQILCFNCNIGKRNNGGTCPHQDC